jgi:hypothetical protein
MILTPAAVVWGAPRGCLGSVAVTTFRISVQPPGREPQWIAVRRTNNIPQGYRIQYQPIDLPADMKRDAKLTFVAVPKATDGQITVLEPRAASATSEWSAPFDLSILVLVFAPQGLDEKRLTNLVTRDENLVEQLAAFAQQTADVEAGLEAVTALEERAEEEDSRPLRSTPAEQAIFALARALNPAASSYNPLGRGRLAGPATLRGKAVSGFFENAGGIFPGSGALSAVKGWLMPDTEFRAVFALPSAQSDGMTLCSEYQQQNTRNKKAFLWAHRLINTGPPAISVRSDLHLPLGMRALAPLKPAKGSDWHVMDRIFDWRLVYESGGRGVRVDVRPVLEERALEIDLRKFPAAEGSYRLEGRWDWTPVKISGDLQLHTLSEWTGFSLTPASEEKLAHRSGPVMIELAGSDFRFLESATLRRAEGYRETELALPEKRSPLLLELNTNDLYPGAYVLTLTRVDGKTQETSFRVFDAPPTVEPFRVNVGAGEQAVTLRGSGLDRIERIDSDRAGIRLGAGDAKSREASITLRPAVRAGEKLTLNAKVESRQALVPFVGALQVAGPKPKILEAKRSLAQDLSVALRDGELPAGSFASFALRVEIGEGPPAITLQCKNAAHTIESPKFRTGEKRVSGRLENAGAGALFLAVDPGAVGQSGCELNAVLETESTGKSDAFALGRVVRLPRIESLAWTDEKTGNGFIAVLKGQDLETIEKAGWDSRMGIDATELPRAVAGEGAKQTMKLALPWPSPSPKAALYVWLRGETEGRATRVSP